MNRTDMARFCAALLIAASAGCGIFDSKKDSSTAVTPTGLTSSDCSGVTIASGWVTSAATWTASPGLTTTVAFTTGSSAAISISGATVAVATGVTPVYAWQNANTVATVAVQKKTNVSGTNTYSEVFVVSAQPPPFSGTSYLQGAVPSGLQVKHADEPVLGIGDYRVILLASDNVNWGCKNFTIY